MGAFTSADEPLNDQWAGEPQSWNMYGYVRNSPMNFTDPSGMACSDGSTNCDSSGGFNSTLPTCFDDPFICGFQLAPTTAGGNGPSPDPSAISPFQGQQQGPGSGAAPGPAGPSSLPPAVLRQLALLRALLKYLAHKPWTISWILPLSPVPGVAGVGPAGGFAWNPENRTVCGSVGIGASAGHNISAGPLTNAWKLNGKAASSSDIDQILAGESITFGGNLPSPAGGAGLGGQLTVNSSGAAVGLTVGLPGFSISQTWAYCAKY